VNVDRLYAAVRGNAIGGPVSLTSTVDLGQGPVPTTPVPLTLASAPTTQLLWLETSTALGVGFDVPPAASVCLQSVQIGSVVRRAGT